MSGRKTDEPETLCPRCSGAVDPTREPFKCHRCGATLRVLGDEDSGGNYYEWIEEVKVGVIVEKRLLLILYVLVFIAGVVVRIAYEVSQ